VHTHYIYMFYIHSYIYLSVCLYLYYTKKYLYKLFNIKFFIGSLSRIKSWFLQIFFDNFSTNNKRLLKLVGGQKHVTSTICVKLIGAEFITLNIYAFKRFRFIKISWENINVRDNPTPVRSFEKYRIYMYNVVYVKHVYI